MNILFVHEVDWLNKVVFDIHDLSELLSSFGHNVFAIDFEDSWKRASITDFGTLKTKDFGHVSRTHDGGSVMLRRPGFIKSHILDRTTAFFTHYHQIKKTVKEENIDIVVLYSVPTNGIPTLKIAKKYKIPVVFRSIDILHMLVRNKILRRITFYLEKEVYSHANQILALTPKLADYVVNLGADEDKVELLLFGVDTERFSPNVNAEMLKDKLGIDETDKVIVFIGTLFEFSGLDKYVQQFPKVLKEVPDAKLVIVGGGYLFEKLKRIVADLKLDDKIFLTGFLPFEQMPQYINLADICINPFQINNTTRDIIPGKIYQYLACAKPVLATPLDGMKSLLPNEDYGVVYSDIDEFGKNTVNLLKDEGYARSIGRNGYRYCIENNDRNKIVHKLEEILLDQLNK